ncbi:MAG: sigma-54 dependent transcriptional regulator [Desulfomonilaceae bacterium]|nr:sigma-54 dependent transcriptional regulator [Desulfomonilaceae bacterium]
MQAIRKVLVIDDEPSIRESLEMFLTEKGLSVAAAATGKEGLALWRSYEPKVIILDIRLPDSSGLDILREITSRDTDVKVIMITAHHDMESTIEAMRRGAYDYIHKPLDVDELDHAVAMAQHIAAASESNAALVCKDPGPDPRHYIVGNTPSMRSIFKTIGLLSRNRATVLIEGETGTGKDLIARVIHESSGLQDQPYVTVDCTTLVDTLLESELFGHERGAFTGAVESKKGRLELAGRGTIFFDEVGDLPGPLQAKLLRFLEYREFTRVGGTQTYRSQARIIAATNRNLVDLTRKGRFREDLLFRLKVISLHVPPLRERIEDLPEMVQVFLAEINRELQTKVTRVEKEAMNRLRSYTWPGNVRELKNVLTKAVMESRGSVLLADAVKDSLTEIGTELPLNKGLRTLDEVEKEHILQSVFQADGNLSAAARALGLSRPTLRKRLKQYGYYGV